MNPRFAISHWATWPDQLGLSGWADAASASASDAIPSLPAMPPMQRRRVERLGRLALQVAYDSVADSTPSALVFVSRWGDVERSIDLIGQLGADGMSPMSFSLSVHNAIAAQFSIARADTRPYTAIAAGDGSVEAAFIEALGQLGDGAGSVTVVYYDEPLPMPYCQYSKPAEFARAWACRLQRVDDGGYSLTPQPAMATGDADCDDALPGDLTVLRFLRSEERQLLRRVGTATWLWQHHD